MKIIALSLLVVSFASLVHASYQIHALQRQVQITKVEKVIPSVILGELALGLLSCIVGCLFYGEFIDIRLSAGLLKKNRSHYMTLPDFQPPPPTL